MALFPRSGRIPKLLALALGLLLACVALEGGARVWRIIRGTPYDRARTEQRLVELVESLQGLSFAPKDAQGTRVKSGMSLHPYAGYQIAWSWKTIEKDAAYYATEEAGRNFDILLMGGSVAANVWSLSAQDLVPLIERDPRLAGRTVIVHLAACPGHKQPQHAANLQWLLSLGFRPDLVLLLDGFNELAVSADNAQNHVHPLFPSWFEMQTALSKPLADPAELELVGQVVALRLEAQALLDHARRWGLLHSAVLASSVESRLEDQSRRSAGLLGQLKEIEASREKDRPPFIAGPSFTQAEVQDMSVRAWREGSLSMQAMCRARGIPFVHVLQPAARDKGAKPLTENEAKVSALPQVWLDAVEQGYPRLREAGTELVRAGVQFHDGSRVFADHPEEIYSDPCHFAEAGSAILGPFLAAAVLDALPR